MISSCMQSGIDVWGIHAGIGEERIEGKLGEDNDEGDWWEDGGCYTGGELSMWSVWSWCWG